MTLNPDSPYRYLITATSDAIPVNYMAAIERELPDIPGLVLFDFLMCRPRLVSRFATASYDGQHILRDTLHSQPAPDLAVIDTLTAYYEAHREASPGNARRAFAQ